MTYNTENNDFIYAGRRLAMEAQLFPSPTG